MPIPLKEALLWCLKTHKKVEKSLLTSIVTVEPSDLGELAEEVMSKMQSGIIALAVRLPGRAQIAIRVSPDYVQKGVSAGALIKEISPLIGGSGGGRPDMAQAGGKNPEGIELAFKRLKELRDH